MTHKDFELIARWIREMSAELPWATGEYQIAQADYFADKLATTNPRFNRDRFLKACGI